MTVVHLLGVRAFSSAAWVAVFCALCSAACSQPVPEGPDWELENPLAELPTPPLGTPDFPTDDGQPPTPETVRLGRWLFYDSRLSADGTVSCGTCHRPDQGFSENERVSTGVFNRFGKRKAQTFVNVAWAAGEPLFWDGRAATLEEQALGPMSNEVEMGISGDRAVQILSGIPAYGPYFTQAFGDPRVTIERVTRAIADYERTRFAGNSAWDRFRAGGDGGALSTTARLGHDLFFGKAGCGQCHLGPNLTDNRFYNVGVGWDPVTQQFADDGRAIFTGNPADRGAFKTPTLRDVSRHPPYLHDGSAATLRDVVVFYNRGGKSNPGLSGKVYPLGLTDPEMDAIVEFMKALDSDLPFDHQPTKFPR